MDALKCHRNTFCWDRAKYILRTSEVDGGWGQKLIAILTYRIRVAKAHDDEGTGEHTHTHTHRKCLYSFSRWPWIKSATHHGLVLLHSFPEWQIFLMFLLDFLCSFYVQWIFCCVLRSTHSSPTKHTAPIHARTHTRTQSTSFGPRAQFVSQTEKDLSLCLTRSFSHRCSFVFASI